MRYDRRMTHLRWFLLAILTALALPAHAADVVFPPGSRIGLAPPPGMTASRSFFGFEDAANSVAIIIAALPPEAYAEIERSAASDSLQRGGVTIEKREPLTLPTGKAFLVVVAQQVESTKLRKWIMTAATPDLTALVTVQVPDSAKDAYPEATVRATLETIAVRASVPNEEQLSLLPFRVGDLAGFRIGGVMAGRAVMLTDAPADAPGQNTEPHLLVAVAAGGPPQPTDRSTFARDLLASVPNLREVYVDSSEPLRISGQQGHQIMAQGKDGTTGAPVKIVQWLRFGNGAYMHMVGVARSDGWTPAYTRFRQVRDGIDTH
jgi:hypothetical protein